MIAVCRRGYPPIMPWYLNPVRIAELAGDVRAVIEGGGPAGVQLRGIEAPRGWLLPSCEVRLRVITRDGHRVELRPEVPVALPIALGYRLTRILEVPGLSRLEPEAVRFSLGRR